MRETTGKDEREAKQADPPRAAVAGAIAIAALVLFWAWHSSAPPPTLPGTAPVRKESVTTEKLAPVYSRAPAEPAVRTWPRLKDGIELLEHGKHEAAVNFFQQQSASGNLSGDEAGMALYYQADALFSLDRLQEAGAIYRKFLEAHPAMPASDNARSALEYIAHAADYRKALSGGGKP